MRKWFGIVQNASKSFKIVQNSHPRAPVVRLVIFLSLFTHDPNLCISHLFWIKWRVNAYPFYIMYWIIFLFLVFYRSKIYISIVYSVKKAFLKIQSGKCNKQNAKYILENAKCKIFFIFKNTIFQMKSVKWNL